jgi:hypothetical protein
VQPVALDSFVRLVVAWLGSKLAGFADFAARLAPVPTERHPAVANSEACATCFRTDSHKQWNNGRACVWRGGAL